VVVCVRRVRELRPMSLQECRMQDQGIIAALLLLLLVVVSRPARGLRGSEAKAARSKGLASTRSGPAFSILVNVAVEGWGGQSVDEQKQRRLVLSSALIAHTHILHEKNPALGCLSFRLCPGKGPCGRA